MKKQLLLFVTLLLPMVAYADESGTCGANLTWTYYESTHSLVIAGSGEMKNYFDNWNGSEWVSTASWYKYHSDIVSVTLPEGLTSIGNHAFNGFSCLTSLIIPNCVTSIGEGAFRYCGLTSVTIPNSVTTIGNDAFNGCSSLTSLTIPNSVTYIGNGAFYGCSGLTSVTIPNSVTSICDDAFSFCSGLTFVNIPNSVTSIGFQAFMGCFSLTSVNIPNSVTSIGNSAFTWCSSLTSVTIPNSVTSIGFQTFSGCSGLTSLTIPNSVTSIGDSAFSGCSGLTSLTIPNSVTSIGDRAFSWCSGLTSLTIPNSVTSIGNGAFNNCSGLTSVTIPNSVTEIGAGAFDGINFGSVTSLIENPFAINGKSSENSTFSENTFNIAILCVPAGTKDKYKAKDGWKDFVNIIEPSKPQYNIIYIVDGEIYKTVSYDSGASITSEPAPEKEGYTFSGWSEIPATMPAHDVTVTGSFAINKYKLTYKVDGVVYKSYEIEYGAAITPEPDPTKEGHTFSGWSWIPTKMPAEDVTVTGTFAVNKYKLIYKVDGEVYKTYEIEFCASITPEDEPTKEGYTFSGWSWIPSKMPAEDVTITGSFTINQYTITYIIDGEVYQTVKVDYNSKIIPPTPPEKEGFDFTWGEYPETMPAHDITISGNYTTGIMSIELESEKAKIFTLEGKQVEQPQKGLNIVRMNDGSVKKVVVK